MSYTYEEALTADILRFAGQYGRYGYRRVYALLRSQGWKVSRGRVMRIWRHEGHKVPQKQPKRGRLWLNDGSCIRLRPERRNHVWSWDFIFDRTVDGRPIKLMVVIDEYTRECLAVHMARRIRGKDAIDVFADLMEIHGIPEHICSDNARRGEAMEESKEPLAPRTMTKFVYLGKVQRQIVRLQTM